MPVDPAVAQRRLQCLGVSDRHAAGALLGELEPHALRGVVIGREPPLPGGLVFELEDREILLGGHAHVITAQLQAAAIVGRRPRGFERCPSKKQERPSTT